jgi:hypothetical protein
LKAGYVTSETILCGVGGVGFAILFSFFDIFYEAAAYGIFYAEPLSW